MTAAERAAAVLSASRMEWSSEWALTRADETRRIPDTPEQRQVAALMADPGLLVDLAIEAGGLVRVGAWCDVCDAEGIGGVWDGPDRPPCPITGAEHTESAYRRVVDRG